jgi:hypothetical protein
MAKYECCGMPYADSKSLTSHMRAHHNTPNFDLALACCDTTFLDSRQLSDHMKERHHVDLSLEI